MDRPQGLGSMRPTEIRKIEEHGKVIAKDVGKHSSAPPPPEFYKASELRVLYFTEGTKKQCIILSDAQKID